MRLSPEPHLFVLFNGSAPGAGGSRHSLRGLDEVRLGRGGAMRFVRSNEAGAAIGRLELPCGALSSAHVSLRRAGTAWLARDLGSKNGTLVNGARVSGCE